VSGECVFDCSVVPVEAREQGFPPVKEVQAVFAREVVSQSPMQEYLDLLLVVVDAALFFLLGFPFSFYYTQIQHNEHTL